MAEGGSVGDLNEMLVEDSDRDETLDPRKLSVSISNSFYSRLSMRPGWGNDWQTVDRQTKKMKKFSSGSVDNESFMNLPDNEKLICLFDSLNRSYEKLSSVELTQKRCVSDSNTINKGLVK